MDHFFQYDLWFDDFEVALVNQSSFFKYTDQASDGFEAKDCGIISNHVNVNKKMIEFVRRNLTRPVTGTGELKRGRGYTHVINERMRRAKHKQSYASLHSMLPPGTKSDYNSIIEMAAKNIEEIQRYKKELERRNNELEERDEDNKVVEKAKIKLWVSYPSSGITSMLEVLKCLKNTDTKIKAIQSTFSAHELSAAMVIETKIEAADVEKAVNRTLHEVEMKLRI